MDENHCALLDVYVNVNLIYFQAKKHVPPKRHVLKYGTGTDDYL